ncbi:MAG TPA: hypothetical protein PLX58_00165 [Smithellaceae bacterium]|jgi:hypothetical protein|nr:hypothetical protein [Smithellaceae bacterium]HQG80986.1 hypothetical protein [Smithellaceae bacterium]
MIDKTRRNFFYDFFVKNSIKCVSEALKAYKGTQNELDYFNSFESAYPLISESYSFLDDEVERLGIDTEGMTKLEIVREIYQRDKKYSSDYE